ncbi:MAG TPA: very short patch repair endonuclease [Caulobacteraceae bacterium]|nr:very short patch repair endonuclease [Caulobacteraceae bacterium]
MTALRTRIMRSVRSQNSTPELRVRRALHRAGFRYRLHVARLPGTPDIVFAKRRVVIFVHGCFWHRHSGCRYASNPKTRVEFWTAKFNRNVRRDSENKAALEAAGWRVIAIWECDVKSDRFLAPLLEALRHRVHAGL